MKKSVKCPKCGSEEVQKTGLSSGVGSGTNPPITSHQYHCKVCDEIFNYPYTDDK